ncbi:MAG TPA: hypothetical protein VIY69_13145 [Candidatus Acidoferrales bacterium]
MKRNLQLSIVILGIAAALSLASAGPQQQQAANAKKTNPLLAERAEGERVFQANCGRCHTAPETLSPREVPAVLRQMRVRANLSAKDQQVLLKLLAP